MKTNKHNHTLTNLLKVFVFSLMILMPFIIFIPNAFYYGFNEQAVAQEKTEQVPVYYESNKVNDVQDLHIGNVYYYSNNVHLGTMTSRFLFNIKPTGNLTFIPNLNSVSTITFYLDSGGTALLWVRYTGLSDYYTSVSSRPFDFVLDVARDDFSYTSLIIDKFSISTAKILKEYQPVTTNMSITDSMSYAWKSTWQNDLFSWTGTTAIYTGINATTSGIGISENSYIANYLAYIFLLTVIYVIVDIILGVFTMLTHLFNKEPK